MAMLTFERFRNEIAAASRPQLGWPLRLHLWIIRDRRLDDALRPIRELSDQLLPKIDALGNVLTPAEGSDPFACDDAVRQAALAEQARLPLEDVRSIVYAWQKFATSSWGDGRRRRAINFLTLNVVPAALLIATALLSIAIVYLIANLVTY